MPGTETNSNVVAPEEAGVAIRIEDMTSDRLVDPPLDFGIEEHEPGLDVTGTGFTVLDRILLDGTHLRDSLGGSCGNVLLTLAMLGRSVAPILSLGDDEVGRRLARDFARAGADVGCVRLRPNERSPVLIHEIESATGEHSFRWPEGDVGSGRYVPINAADLDASRSVIARGAVFYADRLSGTVLDAMRIAWESGAIIFYEPSDMPDEGMLRQALAMASLLKCSADRLGTRLADLPFDGVRILTKGAEGLSIDDGSETISCPAVEVVRVLDACGSGDLVSVSVIDHLLKGRRDGGRLRSKGILDGIRAGQKLASENCRYPGARGLLEACGADYLARTLRGGIDPA